MTDIKRSAARQEHVFLIRVWYEPGQEQGGQWRGTFSQLPSGLRLPIRIAEQGRPFLLDLEAYVESAVQMRSAVMQFRMADKDEADHQCLVVEIL
jgi:hypothetical protein